MRPELIKSDYREINDLINRHISELRDEYYNMPLSVARNTLVSEYNYKERI